MAKQIEQVETTKEGSEGKGSNNNIFQTTSEKNVSNDNYPNGMGMARPAVLKPFENIAGVEAIEQAALKNREFARYDDLVSSGAMGNSQVINAAGIPLNSFGGAFSEKGGGKPNIQGGANK